ncbi:MAG: hypothetical protein ACK5JH_12210 [Anaerocolumna sp.]
MRTLNKIIISIVIIFLAVAIILFPNIYFYIQEYKILNQYHSVAIDTIIIEKNKNDILDLYKKLEMIYSKNNEIEQLSLKTGDRYSLYEARKQCYRELRKIPILEIGIYGPPERDIDIAPTLIIDATTPSYTMIIWQGSLTINNITYRIILDEISGKLLQIQREGIHQIESETFDEELNDQWEKYLLNE